MNQPLNLGILGCGDFLRWMAGPLSKSTQVRVRALYDPELARAEKFAATLGGKAERDADAIFSDREIDVVILFVPPWIRRGLIEKAIAAGKHILTTKPLAPNEDDSAAIVRAVEQANVRCGLLYNRSGNANVEACKRLFANGEIGKLALYKQDWIHHYPEWNVWATDPARNGGPFMDAMIHNLNTARYLMGRPVSRFTFFADSHAHTLKCADTESMKLDFAGGGSAHLFVTWAADLAVHSKTGNDREHIDLHYMVTDKGWYVTGGHDVQTNYYAFTASREGQLKKYVVEPLAGTTFDRFAAAIQSGGPLPADIPSVREASEDIALICRGARQPNTSITL